MHDHVKVRLRVYTYWTTSQPILAGAAGRLSMADRTMALRQPHACDDISISLDGNAHM